MRQIFKLCAREVSSRGSSAVVGGGGRKELVEVAVGRGEKRGERAVRFFSHCKQVIVRVVNYELCMCVLLCVFFRSVL